MTEHDTDIDFDFFEDEEPPTQESPREGIIPRRGPRGPKRPPSGPTNLTPLLRLVGLIAFAILIVVLVVFWIQSCSEASKEKTYKDYMSKVSEVAGSSQQIGRGLSQALSEQGLKEAQVEQRIGGLARQEQLDVDRARQIKPPGTLTDEHQALIQALQYRVSGLSGLTGALAANLKIAFERLDNCRMQRHEPALAELGLTDVQDTTRLDVVEPERKSLGYAQSPGRARSI